METLVQGNKYEEVPVGYSNTCQLAGGCSAAQVKEIYESLCSDKHTLCAHCAEGRPFVAEPWSDFEAEARVVDGKRKWGFVGK